MNSRPQNTALLVLVSAAIMVTVVAMVAAVLIAGQRPVVVVVPPQAASPTTTFPASAVTTQAAVIPAVASAVGSAAPTMVETPPQVVVTRVAAAPSLDDPFDPAWDRVPVSELALEPQQMAAPMLDSVTIATVSVQAVRDDRRIVWRLSWAQPRPSHITNVGTFPDAVAIQLPMVDGAPFTMGGPDMPVRLLHWKALWQKDIDEGFQDVHHQYPNMWVDLYWFADGRYPFPLPEAFSDPRSRQWLIAHEAGNPMADFERSQPVEELAAEGFGTATHVPDSPSRARGQWRDGQWVVVLDRPLRDGDDLAQRLLTTDAEHAISLAVWDGSAGNVGGRKHWCNWVPMRIEP
jgi:hypothetical protein